MVVILAHFDTAPGQQGLLLKDAFANLSGEVAMKMLQEHSQQSNRPTNEEIWQRYQQEMQQVSELVGWLATYFPVA